MTFGEGLGFDMHVTCLFHVCQEVIYALGAGFEVWDANSGDGILHVWED